MATDPKCLDCRHVESLHDGMGDCHATDRRTTSGLCDCPRSVTRSGSSGDHGG